MKKIDWKKVATPKEMGMWGGFMALVLLLALKNYVLPLNANYNGAAAELAAKKIELKSYEEMKKSKSLETKNSSKDKNVGKQSVARKVKEVFDQANTTADVVTSELVAELTKAEYEKLAHLEKFNFNEKIQNAGYSQKEFEIKLSGTYDGIAEYLGNIHRFPQILKIESIEVKPLDPDHRELVSLLARGILYISDVKATPTAQSTTSRSDTGIDILMELNRTRTSKFPFAKNKRENGVRSIRDLILTSTLAGSAHPSALISGKSYGLGDEVAEFKLVEVRPQEVVLQRGDVEVVLKMSDRPSLLSEDKENNILKRAESRKSTPESQTQDSNELKGSSKDEEEKKTNSDNKTGEILKPHSQAEENTDSTGASAENSTGGASSSGAASNNTNSLAENLHGASSASSENQNQNEKSNEEIQESAKMSELASPAGTRQEGSGNHENGNSFISGETPKDQNEDNPGSGIAGGAGGSTKRKLKPSEVEDISGVPYEDLEDPLEHLWG